MENKQGFCPVCGSDLTGCYDLVPEFSDGELFFSWKCKKCDHFGEEHYTMTFEGQFNFFKDED